MTDPYDTGIPKYSTAEEIYCALREVASGEEISLLSSMYEDVSWDGQDYYYIDNAGKLQERFEDLRLSIWRINEDDVHDLVWDALNNDDLAKRLGFKKLFTDIMLRGDKSRYDEISEAYLEELLELNRFDFYAMNKAWLEVARAHGEPDWHSPYNEFCNALYKKAHGLRLDDEMRCIAECRALLTGHDDFIYGLRENQRLYETLNNQYTGKLIQLQKAYDAEVRRLHALAEQQGVRLELGSSTLQLGPQKLVIEIEPKNSNLSTGEST